MTPGQGLGMLFVGIVALSIGAAVIFIILRKVYRSIHKSKRRFDDLEYKIFEMSKITYNIDTCTKSMQTQGAT